MSDSQDAEHVLMYECISQQVLPVLSWQHGCGTCWAATQQHCIASVQLFLQISITFCPLLHCTVLGAYHCHSCASRTALTNCCMVTAWLLAWGLRGGGHLFLWWCTNTTECSLLALLHHRAQRSIEFPAHHGAVRAVGRCIQSPRALC